MRTWIAVAVLCAVPTLAHADRGATLAVTAGGAVMGDAAATGPDRLGSLVEASLAWEKPAPEFPTMDGTAIARGQLIPEVGIFSFGDRGGVLGGARLQLDVAQRRMGLFGISARMSIWLAPRVGLVQGANGAIAGGDFGEIFYWGHSNWRAGMVMGVYTWKEQGSSSTIVPLGGAIAFHAEPPGSQQLAITFGIVIGR